MALSSDLFGLVLSCLYMTIDSQTGEVLPPQNVSLDWIHDFEPRLSWAPPQHLEEGCTYEVVMGASAGRKRRSSNVKQPPYSLYLVMEGGFLNSSVKTKCNGRKSETVDKNVSYPELVKNLECFIHSSKITRCSWIPASQAPDLGFFYYLVNEDLSKDSDDDSLSSLQSCASYTYTDGVRTGCDLQAKYYQDLHILFNATLSNTLARNTFRRSLKENVRPPPLTWTVTKSEEKIFMEWNPPDIKDLGSWSFTINYTVCNDQKFKVVHGNTSAELDVVPHCRYRMSIKAKTLEGETPWSDERVFDAATDPNVLVYAAVIAPLMLAGLAALAFVYWQKNKDDLFPEVPVPRDLLSDISDNNNESAVGKLYVLAEEEDNCEITLVIDSLNSKPDL